MTAKEILEFYAKFVQLLCIVFIHESCSFRDCSRVMRETIVAAIDLLKNALDNETGALVYGSRLAHKIHSLVK